MFLSIRCRYSVAIKLAIRKANSGLYTEKQRHLSTKKVRAACQETLRSCRKIIYLPRESKPAVRCGEVNATLRGLQ